MPDNILAVCLVDIAFIDPDNLTGVKPPVGIRFKTAEYARRLDGRCYWGGGGTAIFSLACCNSAFRAAIS